MRTVRYAVGDVIYVIGRFLGRVAIVVGRLLVRIPVSLGRAAASFWRSLSVIERRRLAAALAAALAALVFFSAVVPHLPCELPGGDRCPPADDAAELVPADALGYLHANLDPGTDEYADAAALAARLPVLGGQLAERPLALIPGPEGGPPDFDRQLRPWFGGEAALAVLTGAGPAAERVNLLEVADADGAADYAASLAVGQVQTSDYEGVEVSVDRRRLASAQVEGFLVIGTQDGVQEVIATATGADGAASLADDPTAAKVRDELPEHRVAEGWASERGIADLIAPDPGLLGTLTPVIGAGASRGVAASLSVSGDGFELAVRSALDPEREKSSPGFFAAFPAFEPDLAGRLAPDTLAYLGLGAPAETVAALLTQASVQAPGIAAGFDDLADSLRRRGGVELGRRLLEGLGDEAAIALEPAPADQAAAAVPYLIFLAQGVDTDAARRTLAELQGPIAAATNPGGGQAPVFGQAEVSGVETNSLRVSPAVELTYAVFDGLAAIATNPAGVAGVIDDDGGLDEQRLYRDATDGFPDQVALLAYFNLEGLVETGERAGLAEDPLYATFAGDLRRLDAFGLAVSSADDVLATDARLLVGEPPPSGVEASPVSPSGD